MAKFLLSDLFVITCPCSDRYSFDTSLPEEIFTTREDAQAHADRMILFNSKSYAVESLSDRLNEIKDQCYEEGHHSS